MVYVYLNLSITTNDARVAKTNNAVEKEERNMKKQVSLSILKGQVELIQV